MNIVVIGNGSIGLMTAWRLVLDKTIDKVTIVGRFSRPGCASLAAAAMFNSYAEIEEDTLKNRFDRSKWLFNKQASRLWPGALKELEEASGQKIFHGFGTTILLNSYSDSLEDRNFHAIRDALDQYSEPHQLLNSCDLNSLKGYNPLASSRALCGIHIPGEGFCNPIHLVDALCAALTKSEKAEFIDDEAVAIEAGAQGLIAKAKTIEGAEIYGDAFVLANGCGFSPLIEKSGLGLKFPRVLYGVGNTVMFSSPKPEHAMDHCVRTPNRGLACGLYAAPRSLNSIVVGATNRVEIAPVSSPNVGELSGLLTGLQEQLNSDYRSATYLGYASGWRPTSEDTMPLIGRADIENLFVATGTKRDGLHCAPLIALVLCDIILGRPPSLDYDISLFAPCRSLHVTLTRQEAVKKFIAHSMNANYQHDFVPARNSMLHDLEAFYRRQAEEVHDFAGAGMAGIPVELHHMYKHGHLTMSSGD